MNDRERWGGAASCRTVSPLIWGSILEVNSCSPTSLWEDASGQHGGYAWEKRGETEAGRLKG